MDIQGSVALVTGANRGLGRLIAAELQARGADVVATARDPRTIDLEGVRTLALDVTDPTSIAAAADAARDVTLLVNNAGSVSGANLLTGDRDGLRRDIDVNYFGPLDLTRAFVPVLRANGGGGILNVLSVVSYWHPSILGAYSAAKAAAWGMTNAVREELAPEGIAVTGLFVGYMDTDMAAHVPAEQKVDPADVARQAIDGVASGAAEVYADEVSRQARAGLAVAA
jgi:NAD(P)-dependent dehydrogenase (short-subunit alcohol dehydrogenase family)